MILHVASFFTANVLLTVTLRCRLSGICIHRETVDHFSSCNFARLTFPCQNTILAHVSHDCFGAKDLFVFVIPVCGSLCGSSFEYIFEAVFCPLRFQ